jgi:hypothetical protein
MEGLADPHAGAGRTGKLGIVVQGAGDSFAYGSPVLCPFDISKLG